MDSEWYWSFGLGSCFGLGLALGSCFGLGLALGSCFGLGGCFGLALGSCFGLGGSLALGTLGGLNLFQPLLQPLLFVITRELRLVPIFSHGILQFVVHFLVFCTPHKQVQTADSPGFDRVALVEF